MPNHIRDNWLRANKERIAVTLLVGGEEEGALERWGHVFDWDDEYLVIGNLVRGAPSSHTVLVAWRAVAMLEVMPTTETEYEE